jgi:hypothetical protein
MTSDPLDQHIAALPPARPRRILLAGVYLADAPNMMEHLVVALAGSKRHRVDQRWVGLGDAPVPEAVAAVTLRVVPGRAFKFTLFNELLVNEPWQDYDYVFLCDDDIEVPDGFIDHFIDLQESLGFAAAQPARTAESYSGHLIVVQQPGLIARETRFVESGPVISFTREAFGNVFPFDDSSGMGWGLEYIWAHKLAEAGMRMGIIDAVAVVHTLRPTAVQYDEDEARRQEHDLTSRRAGVMPQAESLRVLRVYPYSGGEDDYRDLLDANWQPANGPPSPILRRAALYLQQHGVRSLALRALQPWRWQS